MYYRAYQRYYLERFNHIFYNYDIRVVVYDQTEAFELTKDLDPLVAANPYINRKNNIVHYAFENIEFVDELLNPFTDVRIEYLKQELKFE